MTCCITCSKPILESHTHCGTCRRRERRAAVAAGETPPPPTERVRDVEPDQTALLAQLLIVRGYLPAPFTIHATDGRPVWDIDGIARMFDVSVDDLVIRLHQNGPVHLTADRGIPSSWHRVMMAAG